MQLQFSKYDFKIRVEDQQVQTIFDIVRRKYIRLTPEEWVRQHIIHYLVFDHQFPRALISVEKQLLLNDLQKRTDIVLYARDGSPRLIVECKAPEVQITQQVFDQVARYNLTLKVPYLWVTNGNQNALCSIDHGKSSWTVLENLPAVVELIG